MYCSKCKRDLPETEFYKHHKRSGYLSQCKDCCKSYAKSQRVCKDFYEERPQSANPAVKALVKEACKQFDVSEKMFYSNYRGGECVLARKYVAQNLHNSGMSYSQIGRELGIDHSVAMYFCNLVNREKVHDAITPKALQKHYDYKLGRVIYEYV